MNEYLATLARGSKSFNFASKFLPRERRHDAAVVYSLCRLVDDVADERSSEEQALSELDEIRRELLGRRAARPLTEAFLRVSEARRIDVRHMTDLIDGVVSDLGSVRIQDDAELHRYCYRVAGTVGLMMCGVIGVKADAARPFAVDLGIAMQLTNICRDVAEDARLGRVYLPADKLRRVDLDPEALVRGAPVDAGALRSVVSDLLARAERLYESADRGMAFIPFRPRVAIVVASRVYREIGHRLWRRGANPLLGRTVVPKASKLWVSIRAMFSLASPRMIGWAPLARDPSLDRHVRHFLLGAGGKHVEG